MRSNQISQSIIVRGFFFLLVLIIISTSSFCEWHWVEIPTTSPPVMYQGENENPVPFRVGYDPITESVAVNLVTQDEQFQTWRFDGTSWHYVSEYLSGYTMQGDIVFLEEKNELYDLIFTYNLPYWTRWTLVRKWNDDHWEELDPISGGIQDATYDTVRKKIVILLFEDNTFSYLAFYDGENVEYLQLPLEICWPILIEYDPVNDLHLIVDPGSNLGFIWEYRNDTFQNTEVPFPYDPTSCFDVISSMAYFPPLEGMLIYTLGGCTLLYKDHSWIILMNMPDDYAFYWADEAQIVYFPPTQDTLLFLVHRTTLEMKVFRFRERAHTRPFEKP